jgi:3',5'-cyclic AMP phosphodiesterase CpdA
MGYQQQQGYPEALRQIVAALNTWLSGVQDIAFVLHGGDMVDAATEDNVREADALLRLAVPVYLCLGNHDLTSERSLELWLALAPRFFKAGAPEFSIETDDCMIHVAPNHWDKTPYFWRDVQEEHFREEQLGWLAAELSRRPDAVHLLSTHSPAMGVPTEQTGHLQPCHGPAARFQACLLELAGRHRQLRCILGAHNHLNMSVQVGDVHCVTVSALAETPFEFKLFEITPAAVAMSTHSLFSRVDFKPHYEFDKAFVQGRKKDRSFCTRVEN